MDFVVAAASAQGRSESDNPQWGWAVPPNTYQPPEIKSAQASAANAENLEVERGFVSVLIVSGIFALGLPLVLL